MRLNKDVLTAKIQKVKRWTKAPGKRAKTAKQIRMSILMANVGDYFHELFSAQKQNVIDEIIYKSVETGVYTAHLDTLKKNVIKVETGKRGIGASTVKATVKLLRLHASQEFYIGQTGNGGPGAYVFVDLRHPKAAEIMAHLFGVMVATTGVDNTSKDHHNNLNDDRKDGSLSDDKNATDKNAENAITAPAAASTTHEENKQNNDESRSLSFSSFSPSLKDLKPKQARAVNLFGKVCKLLNIVKSNSLVTKLMRLAEKAKKEIMNFTDDHFVFALNEALHYDANDIEAYTASIIYKAANKNVNTKSVPKALQTQNENLTPLQDAEQQLEDLKAKRAEWLAADRGHEWLYLDDIERLEAKIAKLKGEQETTQQPKEPIDFEAERLKILERLGYNAC